MQTVDQWSELDRVVRPHLKRLEPGVILSPDASLGDLGLDSMASIDLLLDLEETFGISINDEELTERSFESLGEIARLVESSRS